MFMYNGTNVKIRQAAREEIRPFCDLVGLVVLNAVDCRQDGADTDEIMLIAERPEDGVPVGCCRIEGFNDGDSCTLSYYLCKQFEYDEETFSEMLFAVLRSLFEEHRKNRIICTHVKKMFARQRFFPESGFVVEVLYGCVNPNGEYLVQEEYVMYREEFEKRYGNR